MRPFIIRHSCSKQIFSQFPFFVTFQNREESATWRTCLVCPSINVSRNSFVLSRNSIRIVRSNYYVFIIITKAIYNNFCKYLQIVAKWFSVIPHENLYNIEDVKDILRCGKCYPECNTVNYNAKISIADLESNQHVAELLWVYIYIFTLYYVHFYKRIIFEGKTWISRINRC